MTFLGRDGEQHHAYATSWGVSTRLVGGLIMAHGDDKGLRLPPKVAPVQVVIVPIFRSDDEQARVLQATAALADEWRALGLRVKVDDRDDLRPGYKFADHELRGVPARVEVGPRDLDAEQVTIARRDTGEKVGVGLGAAGAWLLDAMDQIQQALFDDAIAFRDANTHAAAELRRATRRDHRHRWVRDRRVVRLAPTARRRSRPTPKPRSGSCRWKPRIRATCARCVVPPVSSAPPGPSRTERRAMRPLISVYIAASLDGFIARPDGSLDWLHAAALPEEDYGYDAFVAGVDALAMGRGTYDHIAHLQPLPFGGKPLFVFTHRAARGS